MPGLSEDYEIVSIIGTGPYGICKKIRRKCDKKVLILKELDYSLMNENEKQMLDCHINILRKLKHPHIVRYFDHTVDKQTSTLNIITEYCSGGDLGLFIKRHREKNKFLEESLIWKILHQLLLALQLCHNCRSNGNPLLHQNIKPANVFIDKNHNVKIGDISLVRTIASPDCKTLVRTPYYTAPELINSLTYNEKSDVWSLGCLIYELCSLVPPFVAASQTLLARKICDGKFSKIPSNYSNELNNLLCLMLTVEDELRPSVDILVHHPYLQARKLNFPSTSRSSSSLSSGSGASSNNGFCEKCRSNEATEGKLTKWEQKLKVKEMEIKKREAVLLDQEKEIQEKIFQAQALLKTAQDKIIGLNLRPSNVPIAGTATMNRNATLKPNTKEILPPFVAGRDWEYPTLYTGGDPLHRIVADSTEPRKLRLLGVL